MERSRCLLSNIALQTDADIEESDSYMQKLWNPPSLLALRKAAALMRETNSLSRVGDMDAAAVHAGKSAAIKKDSSCRVVQNVMCLNTQSISRL